MAAAAALAASWLLWPSAAPGPVADTAPAAPTARGFGFDFSLPSSGATPAPALKCERPPLSLRDGGAPRLQCLAPVRARQNGSVRSHFLDGLGDGATWSLRVDTLGDEALAVELMQAGHVRYGCRAEACRQLRIGGHDGRGAREIVLDELPLAALLPDGTPAQPAREMRVSTRFTTLPDDRIAGIACAPDDSVTINTSAGAMLDFCARGGAGVELGERGERTLSFDSLDGGTLAVTTGATGDIVAIDYHGSRHLGCRGMACTGVAIGGFGPQRETTVRFLGTQLVEVRDDNRPGDTSAVLSGSLRLPTLE